MGVNCGQLNRLSDTWERQKLHPFLQFVALGILSFLLVIPHGFVLKVHPSSKRHLGGTPHLNASQQALVKKGEPMQDLTPEQIEAQVEEVMRGLYEAVMRVDLDPWVTTLHDPAGWWHLGMEVVNIREASEKFAATWRPSGEKPLDHQEIDDLKIKVTAISPIIAYALCTSPNRRWYYMSGEVERASTAETWVFVQTGDGWKIHSGQSALFPIQD
jgi:hypothetical protein